MDRFDISSFIGEYQNVEEYKEINWSGSFQDYIDVVTRKPQVTRDAFHRLYDMILSYGSEEFVDFKKRMTRYNFFKDEKGGGVDALYGLEISLMKFVDIFKAAAKGYGPEKRVLLLHGPVGSAKSTIIRLLKHGLEDYSKTDEGAMYSFHWVDPDPPSGEENLLGGEQILSCPIHEEPLKLIPVELREKFLTEINKGKDGYRVTIQGDLCPSCRYIYSQLLSRYDGDWTKVISHIIVNRLILSEKDRIGIGTFQPKDEKNQDSTELTGDVNYRKIAIFGSDSDPRAFNFDGEFNIANRGLVEFIEVLKLDVAFLYDLLGASQEHVIKPKKFCQTDIDLVILGHTNEAEYRKLQSNEYMEALRDRTLKIDVPYVTKLSEEIKIYKRDFNENSVRGKHIAPHTVDMAAMWAVLTRLEQPKKANISLLQKLKLYDGRMFSGFTEDDVKELRKESQREGMEGISPRYIQDKISNALVSDAYGDIGCVNPFMVLNELESGLKHHSLIDSEEKKKYYLELLAMVKQEYEEVVKNEVQRAISADDEAIARLCGNYIDNVKASTRKEKVKNKYTGEYEEPDERLMKSIEEKIDIPESRKDDFRGEIMNYIAALALEGRQFDYKTNERLSRALELKLFEDQKDTIKLTSLVTSVIDKETQEKIDIVKSRLIKNYGYCEICSADVLNYIASIFARGDIKKEG